MHAGLHIGGRCVMTKAETCRCSEHGSCSAWGIAVPGRAVRRGTSHEPVRKMQPMGAWGAEHGGLGVC
jgi:hypothetical protein